LLEHNVRESARLDVAVDWKPAVVERAKPNLMVALALSIKSTIVAR
jgi:hypothetical protein